MLISTALVLLMTPALAFFYGGLVRAKNSLSTMMMSFISFAFVGVLWAVIGYSLAFGVGNDWIGDAANVWLRGVALDPAPRSTNIPHLLYMCYQGTFAIITAALISGAIVERMRFTAYAAFIGLWSLVVYAPVAHWVWGGGWLSKMGALDFAGGTVVHVNAGVAALVAALCVGARRDFKKAPLLPHNVPFTLLGAGLLWFGWFGFNAGSALAASPIGALAFTTTFLAPMGTLLVWTLLDLARTGKPTAVGAATAIVVGLVAITPAAGFIGPMSAIVLGGVSAIPSYFGLLWRAKTQLDDSLDVVAAHGVGGTVGALLTGVFANKALNGVQDGLLFGNAGQLGIQAAAVVTAIVYSGAVSYVLLKIIGAVVPLRAEADEESIGMDLSQHGEEAYVHAGSSGAASF
jgi:Amt family ammonium transporter